MTRDQEPKKTDIPWIDEHFSEDKKNEDKESAELDVDYITMLQELEGK